ncbi:MAG: plasmid mobilization relaxosome protein MobC [Thermoanaerobaculia bacterium]
MRRRPEPRFTLVKPVRFAPEEWDKIRARAAEVRLPPSTYVRQTSLGYRLSGRINARAIYELGRIGNNLNQLARLANTTGRLEHSQQLEAVLDELLDAIRRLA